MSEMICLRCNTKMRKIGGGIDKFTTYVEYECRKCKAKVRFYY